MKEIKIVSALIALMIIFSFIMSIAYILELNNNPAVKFICKEYQVDEIAEKQCWCNITYYGYPATEEYVPYDYLCEDYKWDCHYEAVLANRTTNRCLEYKVVPKYG